MKKIVALIALLGCAAAVVAYGDTSFKFANAAGAYRMGSTTNGYLDFKPSANVAFAYDAGTAVGVSYVVGCVHGQGSRVFGTSSVDTNIYYQDVTAPGVGTADSTATVKNLAGGTISLPASSATTPSTYFATNWTASK